MCHSNYVPLIIRALVQMCMNKQTLKSDSRCEGSGVEPFGNHVGAY